MNFQLQNFSSYITNHIFYVCVSLRNTSICLFIIPQEAGYHHGKTVFGGWIKGNRLPEIFNERPSKSHMTHVYATSQPASKVRNAIDSSGIEPLRSVQFDYALR